MAIYDTDLLQGPTELVATVDNNERQRLVTAPSAATDYYNYKLV